MIKGLAITPPVIGRISIGKLVQQGDRWLPEKDDAFTLTTQVQTRHGWLLHPLHRHYSEACGSGKLRTLPVRLPFNDSGLNLRAEYSAFDRRTGRPLCVGQGEQARRMTADGLVAVDCPGPDLCAEGQRLGCRLYGRLNLQVDGQDDELGSFIFRTTGYNSIRTLAARLHYFEAVSGGHTRYLPLMLRLRARSTTLSHRTPVCYVDLTLREGDTLAGAVLQAREAALRDEEAGLDIEGLERTARQLLRNGRFEELQEDVPALLQEFAPEDGNDRPDTGSDAGTGQPAEPASPPAGAGQRRARLTERLGPRPDAAPASRSPPAATGGPWPPDPPADD